MLMRTMIRSNAIPACVNGHLTKKLNTKTDPAVSNERTHQVESEHLKSTTNESVSYKYFTSISVLLF